MLGGVVTFFVEFNRYVASLLSLPLLLRTFFKPLKNEYRQGLVFFSIVFGMIIKSALISIGVGIVCVLLVIEVLIGLLLIVFPILLVTLIFSGSTYLR